MADRETIQGQIVILNTLRRRLTIQVGQQRKLGWYAPAYLAIEIADQREQIAKIKRYLDSHQVAYDPDPIDTNEQEINARWIADRLAALRRSAVLFDQHREALAIAVQNIRRDAPLSGYDLTEADLVFLAEVEAL